MNFRKKFSSKGFIVILLLTTVIFSLGAVKIYQTGNLKSNGSGNIKIVYSAKANELKENKFTIGNFHFSEEQARKQFSSPNTTVKNVKLDFSQKDSTYFMTVNVDFTNINKLSEARGFSNVKASYVKTEKGNEFKYILTANPELYKKFENQSYIIEFENKVISSNGAIKDNTVTWGNRNKSNSDFSKDVLMIALTESNGNIGGTTGSGETSNNDKEKSCGLFGIELPVILLFGLLTSRKMKKSC